VTATAAANGGPGKPLSVATGIRLCAQNRGPFSVRSETRASWAGTRAAPAERKSGEPLPARIIEKAPAAAANEKECGRGGGKNSLCAVMESMANAAWRSWEPPNVMQLQKQGTRIGQPPIYM